MSLVPFKCLRLAPITLHASSPVDISWVHPQVGHVVFQQVADVPLVARRQIGDLPSASAAASW